jgi:hypothetical protein
LSKEPNGVLVMTTCKCREHGTNLVMTRTWFDETLRGKIEQGVRQERERIIKLLENDQCRPDERFHFAPCACKYIALIEKENK